MWKIVCGKRYSSTDFDANSAAANGGGGGGGGGRGESGSFYLDDFQGMAVDGGGLRNGGSTSGRSVSYSSDKFPPPVTK